MMLTPWGPSAVPTGGAGVAWPACSWILTTARIFFLPIPLLVEALDLEKVELDGRLAAKHVDQHIDRAFVSHDLVDLAVEVAEGAVDDAHVLAHLVLHLDLGGLGLGLLDAGRDVVRRRGNRLVAAKDERGHSRGVANDVPGLVAHRHVDQDVAGKDALLDVTALAVLDFDDLFGGHQDVKDLVVHVHRLDALEEVVADLVLMPRVGVDHVPLALGRLALGGFAHQLAPYRKLVPLPSTRSMIAMKIEIATTVPTTTLVIRISSCRVGQTTRPSSLMVARK